jgi:hypothetical protein
VQPSHSNQPGGRGRYLRIAALLGGALSTLCFIVITRGSATEEAGTNMTRAIAIMLERCAGDSECLEQETSNLVAATSSPVVVDAAIEAYRENPRAVPACHIYMHLLGAHLTAMITAGDAPVLGDIWTECGSGLVHGAFENIRFNTAGIDEVAGVVALCDGEEFLEPLLRHHSCLHAVGHGIYGAVDGDLPRGEAICMQVIPDEASFVRNHPCLAGLYMVDRDERVVTFDVPVDVRGWANLLKHCPQSPRPDVCASSYLMITGRYGRVEVLSYLDWCLTMTAAKTCLPLLGQGATFMQLFTSSKDLDVTTCLDAVTERGLDTAPCLEGSRQALDASGIPGEDIESELCQLLEVSGAACPPRDDTPSPTTGSGG